MPGKGHVYVFNGDFVDRGPNGVEVMCVLLALMLAMPGRQGATYIIQYTPYIMHHAPQLQTRWC
ncbi:hypothetical protein EON64_12410 [archaeon]|nr:MAG: hypothetical protein EON64_12410 [archaeon]